MDNNSSMREETDNSLVMRAHAGDRAALATLLSRHIPTMERHLSRYPLDPADRKDALQDALLQVVRRLSSFRGDAQFSTWLFRVTANAVLMRMRTQRRRRTQSLDDAHETDSPERAPMPEWCDRADARMHRHDVTRSVESAVAALPAHYRVLVEDHYVDGLPLEAIATARSSTESAVRSRLHRARAQLRKQLLPVLGDVAVKASVG